MERMRPPPPQGTGTFLGEWAINVKQKTATQVRKHAKRKMSCADQSGEVGPEQIQERKGVPLPMKRESFFKW